VNYRQGTLADLPKLLELEQAVVEAERPFNEVIKPQNAHYYDIEQLITDEDSYLLVIEASNEIIATGYIQIRESKPSLTHDKHGYLGFMYVDPNHRGKGLNQTLIEQLISWSKNKGVTVFYLDVYAQNSAAIRAYEKVGFVPSLMEMRLNVK